MDRLKLVMEQSILPCKYNNGGIFSNNGGLKELGGGIYSQTDRSGAVSLGAPSDLGFGSIKSEV